MTETPIHLHVIQRHAVLQYSRILDGILLLDLIYFPNQNYCLLHIMVYISNGVGLTIKVHSL